ncbi:MAG: MBL fold metallo-hydrolase [bacterium]|nr:MBL fold metallo-hydrolase [bacterium]
MANSPFSLSFHGAAGEVTGSKHLLHTSDGSKILLDCGLFQGRREEANQKNRLFGFDPREIDAVLLSHAHIDHSGLLPKLSKDGFSGPVFCSTATRDLVYPMLLDSAHIQQEDEHYFRKRRDKELEKKEPLYNEEDVEKVFKHFVGKKYGVAFQVIDGVKASFFDAGHVLGSSVIVLWVKTRKGKKKVVFTGDLGRANVPILRDPELVSEADYLIIESTYGDREHERVGDIEDDLEKSLNRTIRRGGKVIIPAFALERTQEMILRLEDLLHRKIIPPVPIFVDSPLATKITRVFEKHPEYYDDDMRKRAKRNKKVFSFANLRFTESVEESKEINFVNGPCIIIAGSGMCENGRVRHHLKANIEDHRNSVLIVGYQAEQTLGRKLVEGKKIVSILGADYEVNADIVVFKSLSAHADMHGLDDYVRNIKGLEKIFLVHGEESSRQAFAKRIQSFYKGAEVILPSIGETYELE